MAPFKAHLIHVGGLDNKGTQALLASDFLVIKRSIKNSSVTVSTSDIEGVNRLKLPFDMVLPPAVDIPYMKADQLAKRFRLKRGGFSYKMLSVAMIFLMVLQTLLILLSIIFRKVGLRPIYRGALIKRIQESNVVISHSDESFKETASLLPLKPYWIVTWWTMLISRTVDILVARSFDKSIILFPNSVGPFRTWIGALLTKFCFNSFDLLLIRDPISHKIVSELKIRTPKILTYDTALLYDQSRNGGIDISFSKPAIGVSPGLYTQSLSKNEVENYIESHAKALDAIIEKYKLSVVFLPHYISGFSGDDFEVSKLISEKMGKKELTKIIKTENVRDFKFLLDQMDMVVSSKMHPAILAATGYVPIMCVAYDHKQTAFFQRLNMEDCTISIRNLTSDALQSKIGNVWNKRAKLRASLKLQIPLWQEDVSSVIKRTITQYYDSSEGFSES